MYSAEDQADYLQAPMCPREFQHPQQQGILLSPNHIHCHQLHQQQMPSYLHRVVILVLQFFLIFCLKMNAYFDL